VDVNVAIDMNVDIASDINVDVTGDMDYDGPCIFGPISNVAQIFYLTILGLLIISIQPIFKI
jgi:hypothetical protein